MKILITGATGFLGGAFTNHYLEKGFHVVALTRSKKSIDSKIQSKNLHWKYCNLGHETLDPNIMQNMDAVIHCAGKAGTSGEYGSYYASNVKGTHQLLEAAVAHKVKKFIYLSTPSIYTQQKDQLNITEDSIPSMLASHYATTKLLGERLVLDQNNEKMRTIALRPRLVLGAGDRNVLPRIVRLARKRSLISVKGKNPQVSVTNLENVLQVVDQILDPDLPESAFGKPYNLANASPVLLNELIKYTLHQLNVPFQSLKIPERLLMAVAHFVTKMNQILRSSHDPLLTPVEVMALSQSMTLDISRAKSALNYQPNNDWKLAVNNFTKSLKQDN